MDHGSTPLSKPSPLIPPPPPLPLPFPLTKCMHSREKFLHLFEIILEVRIHYGTIKTMQAESTNMGIFYCFLSENF